MNKLFVSDYLHHLRFIMVQIILYKPILYECVGTRVFH